MRADQKRSIGYIFLVLFIGIIISSILAQFVSFALPEGVVKDFFLTNQSIGWGVKENNWVELSIIRFKTGLFVDVSVVSFFGLLISWYFLRYFK